ncbi:MAG: ATP-binding cassette domain-containing protein [Planctomycetota bacterium]
MAAMISLDRFSWRYSNSESWGLRDISFRIESGEFVTIVGPSGSGKSTLALAMCGLLVGRHTGEAQGSVYLHGRDIATTPLHQTARAIGLVQQNPDMQFATLNVGDEIAFGMENRCLVAEEIRRRSAEASEWLSIGHLHERNLSSLSGGDKQRVAIASIVAGGPDALVLDEPTASLDPATSRDLFHSLADLCRQEGLTVVIIEHKLSHLLPLKPRLICLLDGRVEVDASGGALETIPPACLLRSMPIHVSEPIRPGPPAKGEVIVDMSDVAVQLDGRSAITDISLQVRAGEVVGVMGPNGGGKSTLLLCLLGLVSPVRGSVTVCGVRVVRGTVCRLTREVGIVFQNADHQLVASTVWRETLFTAHNMRIAETATEREGARLLETARLYDRRHAHPYRLSWGEKRRLNLISAILHRPRLLLLDEPFAGQDWRNVTFQLDAIRNTVDRTMESSRTVGDKPPSVPRAACLMVTHDPQVVLHSCTRLLFLSDGRVTIDAAVPHAFDQLREAGYDAYTPQECR